MKTTRSDLISRIAEVLMGEALPRRQSTNVRDLRGLKNPVASKVTKDQSRLKAAEKPKDDPEQYRKVRAALSGQHQRIWGKQ